MIFNQNGEGAEELRVVTSSYYANADFDKIAGIVEQVQDEIARQIGTDVMAAIEQEYINGQLTPLVKAAQRTIGYMSVLRYFRLNDISHETDGRKVKMDSTNERRPFEWQLERDDQMHLEEYYNAYDRLVMLLMDDSTFQQSTLYQRIQSLCITSAGVLEWVTGIEATPHLYLRMAPAIFEAQQYVEKRLGRPFTEIEDEALRYLFQAATGNRAVALFVQKTEMKTLPSGAFRIAVSQNHGTTTSSTTEQLHDFHVHMMSVSDNYIHDMQHRRDVLVGEEGEHLIVPNNDKENKYFIM
ncbi:MAG: hypothetical protein IKP36_02740 [Bacteroidaceae bacterium]|nr:hypothetical protein [Prevotella sp.]MBR6030859.1 hypothetical protein [Bacteroidaceae bacterium]